MWVILLWLLTVSESVWGIGNSCYDSKYEYKCGNECVDLEERNCECGGTNLTYIDVFQDGKHCCTDQTCTGAKQNCENRNDSYNYNLNRNV